MRRTGAFLLLLLLLAGCGAAPQARVRLATAVTPYDTGLLSHLKPLFESAHGYRLEIIALGTGQALALAARGDADVVLTHDPEAEERFLAEGHGTDRRPVMHNYFLVVGPPADPAGARGKPVYEALKRIAAAGAPFASRGDDSGTHKKEQRLWEAAGVQPAPATYLKVGAGQAETLRVASEKQAYALSDEGTYRALRANLNLLPVAEGDSALYNPYSVMAVDKPRVNRKGAAAFIAFLTGPEAQAVIASFGRETYGAPLFIPGHKE